jgi:alpha-glucosidase
MSTESVEWWQHGIIYQIYPRSYADSKGDGVGDLRGILERIDYLEWLGVDAIWISPIYPSPMKDFGYDVSQYKGIHPMFGTLEDFDELVEAIHSRGMKLILDFVPNHTSDQHPWFLESRSSRDNPKRDFYIWKDPAPDGGPPNNWLAHFGGIAWEFDSATGQYYYHAFLKEQPDLNWRNPQVVEAMLGVLRFWLERGVDGFRVDVLYHVIKDDQFRDDPPNPNWVPEQGPYNQLLHVFSTDRPEVHDVVRQMRQVLEEYGDGVMIAEIWLPVEQLVTYYGDGGSGTHLPLNFQLIELQWNAERIRQAIRTYEDLLPRGGWPNWVLGNHDMHRVASRIGQAQARVAAMMLLMLRGTPTMYYGDEIGMTNVPIPPHRVQDPYEKSVPGLGLGRDPERTPMHWSDAPNAGFSDKEPWLPVGEDHRTCNVEAQKTDPTSMLSLYRALIDLRRREEALAIGDYIEFPATGDILAWIREWEDTRFLIALNLGHEPAVLDLAGEAGEVELDTGVRRRERVAGELYLASNEGVIMRLEARP